jgi:hypothetical protein
MDNKNVTNNHMNTQIIYQIDCHEFQKKKM